jgi:hypothetical protein
MGKVLRKAILWQTFENRKNRKPKNRKTEKPGLTKE